MPTKRRAASAGGKSTMTLLQERFVAEYLKDLNGAEAYIRAGGAKKRAKECAYQLLKKPAIIEAVQKAQAKYLAKAEVTAQMIVDQWRELADVDVREIIEYRRTCCRYCWGTDNRYHWTPAEFDRETKKVEFWNSTRDADKHKPLPECDGGLDFDQTRDPNPNCPECRGEGYGEVRMKDTRHLSPAAAKLYAGVHRGKDGLKVLIEARDKARENLARYLGMFKEKVEVTGKDGGPIEVKSAREMTDDELAAIISTGGCAGAPDKASG